MLAINRFNYDKFMTTAEYLNEVLTDVKLSTACHEFAILARTAAADLIHKQGLAITPALVDKTAQELVALGKISVREHVAISPEGISVCINVPSLDQQELVWRVTSMIQQALAMCSDHQAVVYFGNDLTFPFQTKLT